MLEKTNQRLIRASAEELYGGGQKIWHVDDPWNAYIRNQIDGFGRSHARVPLARASCVLDIGCGSEPYDWLPDTRISADRFEEQLRGVPNPLVADIEHLPLETASVDFIVCVGAVLNYASAAESISELSRVSRSGGSLLLQFETSTSFEYIITGRRGASVMRVDTTNADRAETLWVYNPRYVFDMLNAFEFDVVASRRFHILSALGLRIGLKPRHAAWLASLDPAFRWCGGFADDVILLARKREGVDGGEVRSAGNLE